jgi:peptidyl-prolyl cis-trans isomerase A (cyclophilin A)
MKIRLSGAMAALATLLLAGTAVAQPKAEPAKKEVAPKPVSAIPGGEGDLYATFTTSMGNIVVKLYEKESPKTVENFVGLATGKKAWTHPADGKQVNTPLFDGTKFHRVLPKFMIQGGDPFSRDDAAGKGTPGTGGPGYKFEDEVNNGLIFDKPGYLAMANAGPNTNGSQFFITEVPTPWLNNKHTIFGFVVSGQDLVTKIVAAGNMKVVLNKVVISRSKTAPK